MSGVRAYSRTKGLASSSGLGNLITLGGLALTSSFTPITDSAGNYSALELNKATTDGFIAVNAPNPANTAGVYYKVAGNVIGDFRADATNGFAVVAQSSYPISFYTQNTAKLALRFDNNGKTLVGGLNNEGYIGYNSGITGSVAAASGIVAGTANFFHEGNNFNFGTYATGFYFGAGGTWVTPTARLHVRGDGTNAVARFEDNAGTRILEITQAGYFSVSNASPFVGFYPIDNTLSINKNGFGIGFTNVMQNGNSYYFITALSKNATSGTSTFIKTAETFAAAAGSANYRHLDIGYTINNSGAQTGTATGIFLNATETALNGMIHNLMDLQVGGNSRFRVSNIGEVFSNRSIFAGGNFRLGIDSRANILSPADGVVSLLNWNMNDFSRLNFGGSTNLFPAIKKNGVGLQIRRADDSAYSDLEASTYLAAAGIIYMNTSGNVFIIRGTGSPEGVQSSGVGSLYLRTDGGANTTLYIKESGTGNTGWIAK